MWSDLRISGSELRASVFCQKHKDAPSGCTHSYQLAPHTVDEQRMPGATEQERSTLAIGDDEASAGPVSTADLVRAVMRESAVPLTRAQIRDRVVQRGGGRSQVYSSIKGMTAAGELVETSGGTARAERFVLAEKRDR